MPSTDTLSLAVLDTALGAEQHWHLDQKRSNRYQLVLHRHEMGLKGVTKDVYFHGGQLEVIDGRLEVTIETTAPTYESMSELFKRSVRAALVSLSNDALKDVERWAAMSTAYGGDLAD